MYSCIHIYTTHTQACMHTQLTHAHTYTRSHGGGGDMLIFTLDTHIPHTGLQLDVIHLPSMPVKISQLLQFHVWME